jgi:transcriptional regulator with XRE-family HTH domain
MAKYDRGVKEYEEDFKKRIGADIWNLRGGDKRDNPDARSGEEISIKMGRHRGWLSQIENGKVMPSMLDYLLIIHELSTGLPADKLHPAEALYRYLQKIRPDDIFRFYLR